MKLNKILIGISSLMLMITPTIDTYASSISSSGVSSTSIVTYKYYSTENFRFQYTVKDNQATITQVGTLNFNSIYDALQGNTTINVEWVDIDLNDIQGSTYPNENTSTTQEVITSSDETTPVEPITELIFPSEVDGIPVTTIGDGSGNGVLYNLDGLEYIKYVEIPDNVTTIGGSAFKDCTSIESFSIPDTITYVGTNAFKDTAWLDSQEEKLEEGLLYIGKVAYKYVGNPTEPFEITLKEETTQIASLCFDGINLKKIDIPNSVISISMLAFRNCFELESICIPESVQEIDGGFYNCASINDITVLNKDVYMTNCTLGLCLVHDEDGNPIVKCTDNLTIHGYTGSTAENYAQRLEMLYNVQVNFDYLDIPEILGDFNNDGNITSIDLILLKANVLGIFKSINNADVNQDGNVNIIDLMTLKNQIINSKEN